MAVPNQPFERMAASTLCLLAVPSLLRSSAAAQARRWAARPSSREESTAELAVVPETTLWTPTLTR